MYRNPPHFPAFITGHSEAARARRVASQSADPVPFEEHAVELENRAAELERRREQLDADLR